MIYRIHQAVVLNQVQSGTFVYTYVCDFSEKMIHFYRVIVLERIIHIFTMQFCNSFYA